MKIATWNVNSLRVRLGHVLDWLAAEQPDVCCLQETKLTDENFPADALRAAGYQAVYAGQRTYNGVAILSRTAPADVVTDLPGLEDPQRRVLAATLGPVRVLNLYVPNGQEVGSDKYAYKMHWLEKLQDYVTAQLEQYPNLVVVGDFNIAPGPEDVHDPQVWEGKVLFSEPERAAFQALLDSGLKDSFRKFDQEPGTFSWWDYRAAAFRRNLGLRIDHILCSRPMYDRLAECVVDKAPRQWERPSDHAPVVARFELSG